MLCYLRTSRSFPAFLALKTLLFHLTCNQVLESLSLVEYVYGRKD